LSRFVSHPHFSSLQFLINANFAGIDGGGEEATLNGAIKAPTPPTAIPEPGSLMLVMFGLLGALPFRRKA
jgi:hypothetical protein